MQDLQNCNESSLTSVESRESGGFYNNRSSFCILVCASKLQNSRVFFLEIFPRGLPALTTATHGCVSLSLWVFWDGLTRLTLMLNGCFLKLSQSISSDFVPDMSSRNAFNTIFLNPLRIWWKKHCQSSVFILLHLFCFVFGRITTSVCFLMTSVSLNISNEIQTSSLL